MQMTAPKFRFEWNLGTILQLVVVSAGAVAMFITLENQAKSNANDIDRNEVQLSQMQERVRTLEQSAIRNDERMQNMLSLLQRIDNRLERIEERQ